MSKHLADGVWVEIPKGFKKAKSYNGYQKGTGSSISIDIVNALPDEYLKTFEPKKLKKKSTELLELRPVTHDGNSDAFYASVHEKKRRIARHVLCIRKDDKTYLIKGFSRTGVNSSLDRKVRKAVLSAIFDEEIVEKETFLLASVKDLNRMFYTRDGKYPTESEDESVIEIRMGRKITSEGDAQNLIRKAIQSITGEKKAIVQRTSLENGRFYSATGTSNSKSAYSAIIQPINAKGIVIKCSGNKKSRLQDFQDFVNINFLKTTLQ